MNFVLRTVIVDSDEKSREELRAALSGLDLAWLEAEYSDYRGFAQQAEGPPPDVVLVGIDADTDQALALIAELSREHRDCSVCAVSRSSDGPLILRAVRAGAKEFVTLPVQTDDLLTTLRCLAATDARTGRQPRGSTMIAVAGATGGVGSTSLAVNLACILAASPGRSVALVDLDLTLGDADVLLDTIHDYTLADLTQNIARLDQDFLRRSLARHRSGLYLLPRPVELDDAALVTPEALRRVYALLKASFSHVVVDLSKGYNALDLATLECCNTILLVTQLDLPSLRNVVRLMKSLRSLDGLDEKVRIVVNRNLPNEGTIRLKKAQESVGREFFWTLPNDYRVMVEVSNNGVPLIEQAPRAAITQSLLAMAKALCGDDAVREAAAARRGAATPVIGRWFNFWNSFHGAEKNV
jgi:pilus assembly protein CpaE